MVQRVSWQQTGIEDYNPGNHRGFPKRGEGYPCDDATWEKDLGKFEKLLNTSEENEHVDGVDFASPERYMVNSSDVGKTRLEQLCIMMKDQCVASSTVAK